LAGLGGHFCTVIEGASNTHEYLQFFQEAIDAYTSDEIPVLRPGDIIVVDNVAFHHNEGERIMRPWLAEHGIQYTFTPHYSPDFNPVENCFGKLKEILKQSRYAQLLGESVEVAVLEAAQNITCGDILSFFRHTRCFPNL
jgi:transposase